MKELMDLQVTSRGLALRETALTVAGNLDKPCIANMRSETNTPMIMSIINMAVNKASKISSVYKDLDDDLSIQLTVDIMEKMGTESVDDVLLMFKMARMGDLRVGQYSKRKSFYEAVLQDFIPAYLDLRAQAREAVLSKKKAIYNDEEVIQDPEFK